MHIYILSGISECFDGMLARKFNLTSKLGAIYDTVADIIFITVTLIKVLPLIELSNWIKIWYILIIFIKFINVLLGFIFHKRMVVEHIILNKITGILLLVFPITLSIVDYKYSTILICGLASISAIQESYYIKLGKTLG